jgi:hypothetical protein
MTANYIATGPTLAQVSTNDSVIHHGTKDGIASVGTVTQHIGGTVDADVVLNDNGSTALTLSSKNTILSSFYIDKDGNRVATWVYSE